MKHWVINFIDMKKEKGSFFVPQCECGEIAFRHYEIYPSNLEGHDALVVNIVCKKCFDRAIRKMLNGKM